MPLACLLLRLVASLTCLTILFALVTWAVGRFVVDRYPLTNPIAPPAASEHTRDSDSDSSDDFVDHTTFYKNLNSSSQYLRRDLFVQ